MGNNKKQLLMAHELFTLCTLLSEKLDSVGQLSKEASNINKLAKEMQKVLDPITDEIFSASKLASKTTYIQDLQNKVETIIRKTYNEIK